MERELIWDIRNLMWMARRYAEGRQTYAPSLYKEIERRMLFRGIEPPFKDPVAPDRTTR